MSKSELIKDITYGNVSIVQGLERLLIITYDLNNESLKEWILAELNGYEKSSYLPKYRKEQDYNVKYSGLNGSFQVTSVPLPLTMVPKELRDDFMDIYITEGISTVQKYAGSQSGEVGKDLTSYAYAIQESSGIQCYSITQYISKSYFDSVLSSVKVKLITILLDLEKAFGNLDSLDIDINEKEDDEIEKLNEDIIKVFAEGKVIE